MSVGQLALQEVGIHVDKYYASEIDKYAIAVTQKNFPNTIQIGDVTKVTGIKDIDLLIGGSPCQGFSVAGDQLNFEDPRSKLFFEYARLLKEIKPKYFFLENVKMKQEYQDVISEYLGVHPIAINSSLVSAQNRKRLYWTNIPGIVPPKDRGVMLKDILHEYVGEDHLDLSEHTLYPDETFHVLDKSIATGKVGYFRQDSQANRVYHIDGKAVTLCGEAGGGAAKMGQYLFGSVNRDDPSNIHVEGYIRKLTPIEGERLQTLPDNYTEGVSTAQRFRMLGNGWTKDIITHFFKNIM